MALNLGNIGKQLGQTIGKVATTNVATLPLKLVQNKEVQKKTLDLKKAYDKQQEEENKKQKEKQKAELERITRVIQGKEKPKNIDEGIALLQPRKVDTKNVLPISKENTTGSNKPISNLQYGINQIPLALVSAGDSFTKSITKSAQDAAKKRVEANKTLKLPNNSLVDILKKDYTTPIPTPLELYGGLLNDKGYTPEQQPNYNAALLNFTSNLPKETLKGKSINEQLKKSSYIGANLNETQKSAVNIGKNVINPVITSATLPLAISNALATGYSENDTRQGADNVINMGTDIATTALLNRYGKLGNVAKNMIGGITGSIVGDVSTGQDVNFGDAALQGVFGAGIGKGQDTLQNVKLPSINNKNLPDIGMTIKNVDDNGNPISRVQQKINEEMANIPTETRKMSAEDMQKYFPDKKTSTPQNLTPPESLQPTLQPKQVQSIQEQPKIDLNANKEVIESIQQNVPKLKQKIAESKLKTNTLPKTPEFQDTQIQKIIADTDMTYGIKPNEKTVKKAIKELTDNFDEEYKVLMKNTNVLNSAEETTKAGMIAKTLAEKAKITGDFTELTNFTKNIRTKATNMGQAIQAFKTWQLDSPERFLLKVQKLIDTANENATVNNALGKNAKKIELTPEDTKFIYNKLEEINKLQGREKAILQSDLEEFVGSKIPKTNQQKFKTLLRMAMLSRPSTGIKNFLGNTGNAILSNIEQPLVGTVDAITSAIRKTPRNVSILPSVGAEAKGFVEGASRQFGDLFHGAIQEAKKFKGTKNINDLKENVKSIDWKNTLKSVDSSRQDTRVADMLDGQQLGHIFKNPIMQKAEDLVKFNVRDDVWYQAAYNQRIADQQKLSKSKDITPEMKIEAERYARDRVFNNDSKVSEAALKARKSTGIIGDIVAPFARTPANMLDKTLDYLPITNVVKILNQVNNIKKGTFDQRRFSELVARLGVGGAVAYAGAEMYKNKLYTPSTDSNSKVRAFDQANKKIPYSFNLNDKNIDISNYPPIAAILNYGAEVQRTLEKSGKKVTEESLERAIFDNIKAQGKGVESIFDASFVQGIKDFMKDVGTEGVGLTGATANAIADVPNMLTPSIIKGANNSIDNFSRQTYDPSPTTNYINSLKSSLPYLSQDLLPRRDVWGNKMEKNEEKQDLTTALLNPFKITTDKTDATTEELQRIYEITNNTEVLPRVVNKNVTVAGITIPLSAKEYNAYQKLNGKYLKQFYDIVIETPEYQNASDDDKIKLLKSIQSNTNKETDNTIKKLALQRIQEESPKLYKTISDEFIKKQSKK